MPRAICTVEKPSRLPAPLPATSAALLRRRRRPVRRLGSVAFAAASKPPTVTVVMGVSGCGKSTVGELLAQRLGCPFYEGDAFHPAANVAKMRAGTPLTDEDRWPWLEQLSAIVGKHVAEQQPAVLSCSALKPAYRHLLATGRRQAEEGEAAGQCGSSASGSGSGWSPDVGFVLLEPTRATLEVRLLRRSASSHHFMPARLLDSQLATLQYLEAELYLHLAGEAAAQPPERLVVAILERMQLEGASKPADV